MTRLGCCDGRGNDEQKRADRWMHAMRIVIVDMSGYEWRLCDVLVLSVSLIRLLRDRLPAYLRVHIHHRMRLYAISTIQIPLCTTHAYLRRLYMQ